MSKFKIGSKVRLKPDHWYTEGPRYVGAGYKTLEYRGDKCVLLTIKEVRNEGTPECVYFFKEMENGIYEFALDGSEEIRNHRINELLA